MFDVVMPLYNKEQFVRSTLEAVLAQSFENWRLFVVDDGSRDGGARAVSGYDDPRIVLIEQENRGVGPARNTGIAAGRAEWIAFVDADDLWRADHLAELDALRREFPDAVLIGSRFGRFSGAAAPQASSNGLPQRRLVRYFAECSRGAELFFTSSAAVRRSALEEVGGFADLPGNEDVELWARLALHGPIAVSSRETVSYRVESGGITDREAAARKSLPKPARREDLSSTIPTLERALPSVSDAELRNEIIAYMDSRIGVRLTAAVLDGDVEYARHLRSLYRNSPVGQARIAAGIAKLPRSVARGVVAAALAARRLSRR